MKLNGKQAIEAKEANPEVVLNKYADPIEGALEKVSVEEARKIAREDASLIWCEIVDLKSKSAALDYLRSLGDAAVTLPSGGELTSAAADAVAAIAGESARAWAVGRNRWEWTAAELVTELAVYSDYVTTVKSDPSYYGDAATHETAALYAQRIADQIREEFPGIVVRLDWMIGSGTRDLTDGPDQDVCDQINDAAERAFSGALR